MQKYESMFKFSICVDTGPQLDWDPDIVAALDDDFDFTDPDNQLEDDFIVSAMEGEVSYHEEEREEGMAPKMNRFELIVFREQENPATTSQTVYICIH